MLLVQLFFIIFTLVLIHWKLPETKNKRIGKIAKELEHLRSSWTKTVFTIPDFDFEVDLESKFAKFITPSKIKVNQWEMPFIDAAPVSSSPVSTRYKPKKSISDFFMSNETNSKANVGHVYQP